MVRQKQVCIIGAGVSGLAAAKAFAARGHQITIIERSGDLGGVWEPARSYPEVQTQSPKDLYRYTDKAMPDSYPEWPKGPQVHAYLTEYAKDNDLLGAIRFHTAVLQMDRRPDSAPGWRLDLRGPDGGISHEDFDFVAVCTGQFNEPQTLSLPGEEFSRRRAGASCTPRNTTILSSPKAGGSSCSAVRSRRRTSRSMRSIPALPK